MKLPLTINTSAVDETEKLGRMLAEFMLSASTPNFVAMYGDLGVGKTAFVRGFCSVFSPAALVRSPTFALVNDYKCDMSVSGGHKHIYHFDMYRISGEDDLYSIGFYDYLDSGEICIAEWCELIPFALPDEYIKVKIEKTDNGDGRRIEITLN